MLIIQNNRTVYMHSMTIDLIIMKMNSTSSPHPTFPFVIDPFILRFLSSTIEPPPPLPTCMFFYDPTLVIPPPPPVSSIVTTPSSSPSPPASTTSPPASIQSNCTSRLSNRHRYTPVQLYTLHRIFQQLPYPSLEQRRLIAQHLNMDIEQVRVWFSNRRSRQRHTSQPTQLIAPSAGESDQAKELFSKLHLVFSA